MFASSSAARIARVEAQRSADALNQLTKYVWYRVSPKLIAQLEAELDLYAKRPSKAELVRALLIEGLAFRQMHRSPPRLPRPRREPLPAELLARLKS